jgi:hypothetical protein
LVDDGLLLICWCVDVGRKKSGGEGSLELRLEEDENSVGGDLTAEAMDKMLIANALKQEEGEKGEIQNLLLLGTFLMDSPTGR